MFSLFGEEKLTKERYEKKLSEILKKINQSKKSGDGIAVSFHCQTAAKLAEQFGEYRKGVDMLLDGLEYCLKENRLFDAAWICKMASNLAEKDNKLADALNFAVRSADYFLKSSSVYAAQWEYVIAGKLAEKQKDYYSAIKYYKKANDLESDNELEEQIESIKKKIPHPIIDVKSSKSEIEEGEEVELTVSVENNSYNYLKNIKLIGNQTEEIKLLKPKETKVIVYKTSGQVGILKPRYRKVVWEDPSGKPIEKNLPYFGVRVKPRVVIKASVNPQLRLNKNSDFVLLIKNLSSSNLRNIKYFVDFPEEIKYRKEGQEGLGSIKPGDEEGIVYSLVPKTVGKISLKNVSIEYTDDYGIEYKAKVDPIVLEISLLEQKKQNSESLIEKAREKTKHVDFDSSPMLEEDYIKLTHTYYSAEGGYCLRKVSMEDVSDYVLDECSSMTLIGSHDHDGEKLYFFSGKRSGTSYLLTVAIKKEEEFINVLFKIYSDKQDGLESVLNAIANSVQYTLTIASSAIRVEKIEVNEVINIIDSIVQRSKIGQDVVKDKQVTIKDSVVRKTEI